MTVLDTSREAAMTDTELNADDAQRLHVMEEMMRNRGYSRNQHGFWVASRLQMAAVRAGSDSITSDTGSEDEGTAAAA